MLIQKSRTRTYIRSNEVDNKKTALYDCHIRLGGKIVNFSGWDMPIHYGSQILEHKQVRSSAGMFDVSHMTVLDMKGENVKAFLSKLFANDISRLKIPGKALYSCMLNDDGGIIDDLITYYMDDEYYRTVVNAGTHDKDLAWISQQAKPFAVEIIERTDLSMIAVQGPKARQIAIPLLPENIQQSADELKPFFAVEKNDYFVARTGYTGEDGFEIMLPNEGAAELWDLLAKNGVTSCGLGARDTLRLEAGMNLYGTDMDESITPMECGLNWTVAWEPATRDFIGRQAITSKKSRVEVRFVGLVLEGKGVIRNHQKVIIVGEGEGEITSGSFSPSLGKAIAFARIPKGTAETCLVEVRGKQLKANIVKPVFVRHGQAC
ncbi:MAG TPA: glycine cleavage system aminomethyltransferase GcvT [Gammaproteobacteria bacterium]|nr:glycine cleavage system aminomethyltransferase GcvT [Gammaproteobacteria bacterium]